MLLIGQTRILPVGVAILTLDKDCGIARASSSSSTSQSENDCLRTSALRIWWPQKRGGCSGQLCAEGWKAASSNFRIGDGRFNGRPRRDGGFRRSGGNGFCPLALAKYTNDMDDAEKGKSAELYGEIERVISDTAKRTQGTSGDAGRWEDIQGVWVLRPSKVQPRAVVHFVGGVFVGASPQLTYRLFLERLCERGFIIVATPFASGFDHLRIADEVQFNFDRCIRKMRDDFVESLPVFGVGHSLGSLALLLVGARYAVQRQGNILISFNNKEASKAIPLFSPVVVPMAQNFAPIIAQLTTSPAIQYGANFALRQLQTLSPPLVKQILPLIEQLPPLYTDLTSGKDKFTPTPQETSKLVKSYYAVGRNLLIKFKDDTIDETPDLARILSLDSAVSGYLDMSVRTLPGDHTRPLQQAFPDVPTGMIDALEKGSELLGNLEFLAANTPFANVARGVGRSFPNTSNVRTRSQVTEDIESLVDDLAGWMYDSLR